MSTSERAGRARLPNRVALVEELVALGRRESYGLNVLLTGPQGIGKSVLMEEVVDQLQSTSRIVRWEDMDEPMGADSAVDRYLRYRSRLAADSNDRPTVVVVDDVNTVAEADRRALTEMVRNQEIGLLVTATAVRLAGRALGTLWRDGMLHERRVPELDVTDVMELGRFLLQRRVPFTEATAVLRASAGIPGHAVAALGHLDATPGRPRSLAHVPDVSGNQERILRILARVRDFAAVILVDLYGAEDLDALRDTDVLRLTGSGVARAVCIANPWVADTVAATTPPEIDRELCESLTPYLTDVRLSAGAAADLLLWRHDLGLALDESRVAQLAEEAAENADYGTVHALIEALGNESAPLRGLHTLALASLGRIDAATELARPLLEADADAQAKGLTTREVEALYVLAAMSTQSRREPGEFEQLLETAQRQHRKLVQDSDDPQSLAQAKALREAALTGRWVMDDFLGEYTDLADSVSRVSAGSRVDRTTRALMVGMTAKASAIAGRPLDGQAQLARAVRVDTSARNANLARRHTVDAAMLAGILAGEWPVILQEAWRGDDAFAHNPGWVRHNLVLGAVLLLSGRPRKALQHLSEGLRDSESDNDFPVPQLVVSATACAYAWIGQSDSAKALLRMVETMDVQESYFYRAVGDYFRGLAELLLGDVADGVQRWRSRADDAVARGADGLALVFLQALARAGSELAVQDLLTVSARCQGAWAETLGALAQALDGQRITDMRAALRGAVAMGDLGLAGFLERLVGERGNTTTAGPVVAFPDDELGGDDAGVTDTPSLVMAAVLTTREREVADLAAAGLTNQAIAEEVGLSRRTVEGHMRQVLRKLALSRRTELVDTWRVGTA